MTNLSRGAAYNEMQDRVGRDGMETEVYVDLYFVINASMDFLCMLITARLLHRRTGTWRLLAGAVLGGLYAVAALLLGFAGVWGFVLDCMTAAVLSAVVFFSRRMRFFRVLQAAIVYILVSMVLGGIMTALYTWLNRLKLPFEALQSDGVSVLIFGIMALTAGLVTSRGGKWFGLSQKTESVGVEAVLLGRSVKLRAMVDSGNLLCDPVSGRNVIVADRKSLKGVLPPALLAEGREGETKIFSWLDSSPYASRIRLIPAATATGRGLLVAILPDSLTIEDGDERYESDYLIAVSSLGDRAEGFDAVIGIG